MSAAPSSGRARHGEASADTDINQPMEAGAPAAHKDSLIARLLRRWGFDAERDFVLRVVQPGLVGLIDGTVSSIAPIFAAAVSSDSHTAFVVGIAVALG